MSLVLDIVCLLLLVGGFAVGWSRSPLSSGPDAVFGGCGTDRGVFPQCSGRQLGFGNAGGSPSGAVGGQ